LSYAKVEFSWANVPGPKDQGRVRSALEETLRTGSRGEPSAAASAMVERLTPDITQDRLLLLASRRELERLPKGETLRPVDTKVFKTPTAYRRARARRFPCRVLTRAVVFRVNPLGAEAGPSRAGCCPSSADAAASPGSEVGAIRVGPQYTEFEIAGEAAKDFAWLVAERPARPHVHMEVASRRAPADP